MESDIDKQHKNDRRILLVVSVLIFAGLLAYAPKIVTESHRADFERYYYAGLTALHGDDIYAASDDREFKYFPFFAQVMMPVAAFGEWWAHGNTRATTPSTESLRAGAALWYAILCGSYWGALVLAVLLCRPQSIREGLWLALGAAGLSLRFFIANLRNGQINMPVMFLAVLGIYLVVRHRARLGAIIIALGALIKFMPGVLFLWFIRQAVGGCNDEKNATGCCLVKTKNLLPMGWGLLTIAGVLFLLPALTWSGGINAAAAQLGSYIERRQQMVTGLPKDVAAGQSLPSLTNRLLHKVNAAPLRARRISSDKNVPKIRTPIYINLAELSPPAARRVVLALILSVSALAFFLLGKSEPQRRDATSLAAVTRTALQVALLFLLMLLISPEARKAHYVTLLVPGAALTAYGLRQTGNRFALWFVGGVSGWMIGNSRGVIGENPFYYQLNAYGALLLGLVCLFGYIACILWRSRKARHTDCNTASGTPLWYSD